MNTKNNLNFYCISGGPGVGKTTLLHELKSMGYGVVPEIARSIIQEQVQRNGTALPWVDTVAYKELLFERSIKSYAQWSDKNEKEKPLFFDRSFLDAIGYANIISEELTDEMEYYGFNWRYSKFVFMLSPWKSIYELDSERKQNWNEAVQSFDEMVKTYQKYAYTIVEVPKDSVTNRAKFILDFINSNRS